MISHNPKHLFCTFVVFTLLSGLCPAQEQEFRFEKDIVDYEKKTLDHPLPENCSMFVGSSTWRWWGDQLEKDFAEFHAVNRGFGGSTVPDVLHVMHRIITPHKPARVVFFCGGNDIAGGARAEKTFENLKTFLLRLWDASPDTEVFFVSNTRAPVREQFHEETIKYNNLVRDLADQMTRLHYIDTFTTLAGDDGKAQEKYFLQDRLHLNRDGQERWIPVITQALRGGM
ncbi:MAG: GDSL-type esterase/lipase family protein [Planctomycetaceae bacterium]|nr:GDSL-type esterase/lipase family protein [Planctomycetaceae bacterium]